MARNNESTAPRSHARSVYLSASAAETRGRASRLVILSVLVVVLVAAVSVVVVLSLTQGAAKPSSTAKHPSPLTGSRDAIWHDTTLSANEQIVFSHSSPQTGYSCGTANATIAMHITHDGGMRWQPLTMDSPITGESCLLAIDETNPQQLAILTQITTPDPCQKTGCTPTPCAGACQPCMDYCPPPPRRTVTLLHSADGGHTWKDIGRLPNGVHFTQELAFAGSTLYAWTDTWPTLLAASVAGGPFRLIDLSAYFPASQQNNTSQAASAYSHLWPLHGQVFVPIPGGDFANHYILTADGGVTWSRRTFTLEGDPVELRPGSSLDGRTLMGERIHIGTGGHLVLSTDEGNTWHLSPTPLPDFTHYGQTQCFVSADGSFFWFNGFDATFGLGMYQAGAGATSWTKMLDAEQIQDISVDLVSYNADGHLAALWGRENRTTWVVLRLP